MLTARPCATTCPVVDMLVAALAVESGRTMDAEAVARLGAPIKAREPRTPRQAPISPNPAEAVHDQ